MSNKTKVKFYPKQIEVESKKCDYKKNNVEVIGGTSDTCENVPTDIEAITAGVVAKIPVVLAELTMRVPINSFIELPEYAYEIKNIKKKVKVTQCLLIRDTGLLFIKGFIRKNIDYSTRKYSNREGFSGDIRHTTVDVPFSCSTEVGFNGTLPAEVIYNTAREFEFFMQENLTGPGFATKDKLLSSDTTEYNQISTEYFNELPYCELIRAEIVEYDEALNPHTPTDITVPFEEKRFKKLEEKMVLYLTLKILQKRQVAIPPIAGGVDFDC